MKTTLTAVILLFAIPAAAQTGVRPREGRFLTMGVTPDAYVERRLKDTPEIITLANTGVPLNVARFWIRDQYLLDRVAAVRVKDKIQLTDKEIAAGKIGRVSSQTKEPIYSERTDKYLFPSEESRQAELEKLHQTKKQLLLDLETVGRASPKFPQLDEKPEINAIGHLGPFEVFQVVDKNSVLITKNKETLMLDGLPTAKLVDGRHYNSDRLVIASGTYHYETALGQSTVVLLKPVDAAAVKKVSALYKPMKP